ncbi:MAG TPA: CoxE, partial [Solirubrobacteraceae bacterium]|nr:CoxE [Solirubrobacteraceae bacterium]
MEFGEELRAEGVHSGTAELLDAFAVLSEIPWTEPQGFREGLAATLAKSQEDRRIFDLVFERFFFRATEAAALREGVREHGAVAPGDREGEAEEAAGGELDLEELRRQIAAALQEGSESLMRDLARLAIAAFGRQGAGSGVIGVDVQRIRRSLGLRAEP